MRKVILLLTIAAALAGVAVLPAGAAAEPPNGGGYCGASATGCGAAAEAAETTPCSGYGAGAFGAFGTYGDVTHDFGINNPGSNEEPGADGHQTGLNNSSLCGNRQGNLS